MVEIIQFSDLHFGDKKEFREEYLLNVIDYINDAKPDVAICTGDLVHKGMLEQYKGIVPYLKRIKVPLMCVPGNHDLKSNGIMVYETLIGPRRSKMILEDKDCIIVGLCSAKDDISVGEIGDEQLEWLALQFNKIIENRIIALHHHVIAVPYSGRKQNTLTDAGELLELTQLFEIDLVLMGHKHIPHAYQIGPTTYLYCGTSSSIKVRARESASFNHIFLEGGNLEIQIVNSENLKKETLFIRKDGISKYVRPRKTRIEHLLKFKIFD